MTTFDLAEVTKFTFDLRARIDECENGEGMECANLESTLRNCAKWCDEVRIAIREWGKGVFAGRVAFDAEVEQMFIAEGRNVYQHARDVLSLGKASEDECYVLSGPAFLQAALWRLDQLLRNWVTPTPAIGPSARLGLPLSGAAAEEARQRVAALQPLPAEWQPNDLGQQNRWRKLTKSSSRTAR